MNMMPNMMKPFMRQFSIAPDTMESSEGYVCTLTEASLKKAKKELNEDPKNRMGAVETFRTWIKQQPHFRCKTDTTFLLRFLRYCKFSQLEARKRLEKYLTGMTKYADYLMDIDMTQKELLDVVKDGQLLPLGQDSAGRRVLLFRLAHYDPKTLDKRYLLKAQTGIIHLILRDENTNVNGLVYVLDMTGLEMKHQRFWSIEDMRRNMDIFQSCFPARVKQLHTYNMGPVGDTIVNLFRPMMKKKFRDRIIVHGCNLESVYKVLPMEILPEEYLPDEYTGKNAGSCQSIVDKLVGEVQKPENVAYVWEVSAEANASVDVSMRPSYREPVASFRKLNID